MKNRKPDPYLCEPGVEPGAVKQFGAEWRIALVGVRTVGPDECETFLKYYLPRTGRDRSAINRAMSKAQS